MKEYTVTWTIQVSACNPLDAALTCKAIQLDHDSLANVFAVTDQKGNTETIDLDTVKE